MNLGVFSRLRIRQYRIGAHNRGLAAAAAELTGDGFDLLEDRFEAGLRMLVLVGAGVDGGDAGSGDGVVLVGQRFHSEDPAGGFDIVRGGIVVAPLGHGGGEVTRAAAARGFTRRFTFGTVSC